MKKRKTDNKKSNNAVLPVMRPDAAGIDIGAIEIFIAVPADRAVENVGSFPTFTQDLYAAAEWLKQCGIKTVAMESTVSFRQACVSRADFNCGRQLR